MALVDITGKQFGLWRVIRMSDGCGKIKYWDCVCACGTARSVFGGDLKRGGSLSCGCDQRSGLVARATSHGQSYHPAYRSWVGAKTRCQNPASHSYPEYGGRGIKVALEWETFEGFWRDMETGWSPGLSIERIDVNGDYAPGNCTWATPWQQAQNRRPPKTRRLVETPDGLFSLAELSERYKIPIPTLYYRVQRNWTDEEIVMGRKRNE